MEPTKKQQDSRLPIDTSTADIGTAQEFNLWCAINSKPFRLSQSVWPDGAVEWDVVAFPGRPEETIAYGTAQKDEPRAVIAAFAFLAGIEWAEAALRTPVVGLDETLTEAGDAPKARAASEPDLVPARAPDAPYAIPRQELT